MSKFARSCYSGLPVKRHRSGQPACSDAGFGPAERSSRPHFEQRPHGDPAAPEISAKASTS